MTDGLNQRQALGYSWLVFFISILLFIIGWQFEARAIRGSYGVMLLFALPLLLQFGGLLYLCLRPLKSERSAGFFKLYWLTLFLCAILNYGFWFYYLWITGVPDPHLPIEPTGNWASGLSLMSIGLLLFIISLVTLAFMTPLESDEDDDNAFRRFIRPLLDSIKTGASRRPFWTLLHSMTVFLTISYLFGFAFAFHDLNVPLPRKDVQPQAEAPVTGTSLQPEAAQSPQEDSQPQSTEESSHQMPPLYMASLPNFDKKQPPLNEKEKNGIPCVDFRFAESSVRLEIFGEGDDLELPSRESDLKPVDKDKLRRSLDNQAAMNRAIERINALTLNGQQAHVQLLGHASKTRVKGGLYPNNYVFSEVRGRLVLMNLKAELQRKNKGGWSNVDWDMIPLASDEFPQGRDFYEKYCMPDASNDKVVNVYISSVADHPFHHWWNRFKSDDYKRLTLLEHMYFSMYTITTTGYGDIVPTTNYAKALTCLANICEVFFFVGFFNSLMALKGRDDEEIIAAQTIDEEVVESTEAATAESIDEKAEIIGPADRGQGGQV